MLPQRSGMQVDVAVDFGSDRRFLRRMQKIVRRNFDYAFEAMEAQEKGGFGASLNIEGQPRRDAGPGRLGLPTTALDLRIPFQNRQLIVTAHRRTRTDRIQPPGAGETGVP